MTSWRLRMCIFMDAEFEIFQSAFGQKTEDSKQKEEPIPA